MDLEKLEADLKTDPQLAVLRHLSPKEAEVVLIRVHQSMMSQKWPTISGYLYRQQTLKNAQLKKELHARERQ